MPDNYLTPIKGLLPGQTACHHSEGPKSHRDWICLNCRNLNFSFRKKCNRCKTQSKADNDAQSVYSFYYYPKQQLSMPPKGFQLDQLRRSRQVSSQAEKSKENISLSSSAFESPANRHQTPKKKSTLQAGTPSKNDLPSVSPLVKKYRLKQHHDKQHHTTLEKKTQGLNKSYLDEASEFQLQFQVRDFNELLFGQAPSKRIQNSPLREFSPYKEDSGEGESELYMREMEEIISRIIL